MEEFGIDLAGFRVVYITNPVIRNTRNRKDGFGPQPGAGDEDFLVGAVGRLASRKGFDTLINAFEQAQLPNGRLVLVGEGSERSRQTTCE